MSMNNRGRPRASLLRRALGVAVAVGAAAAGVSGGGVDSAQAVKPRPNIVLVLTDDQRWDTMWAMPSVRHRVGRKGVTFENGYVVNSLCCPSRASLLTGLYSHSTGVYTNRAPTGGFAAFNDDATLPVWLDEAGYRTAFVGKYLNGYRGDEIGYVPPGWDRWVSYAGSRQKGVYYNYRLSVNGRRRVMGDAPKDYSTDVYLDYAARFMRRADDPFFLLLAPNAPHRPARYPDRHKGTMKGLPPHRPPSFNEPDVSDKPLWVQGVPPLSPHARKEIRKTRRNQLRSLLAVDEAVDKLIDILKNQKELGRTVFIFTSDNGLLWGEHRWRNKQVAYEEAVRVPLMVRAPDVLAPGSSSDEFALNIDLAETIADYAGADHPETEGTSLRPLMGDPDAELRSSFLVEHLQEPRQQKPPTYCAVRDDDFSYTAYENAEEELYDMRVDPYQLENVADDPEYSEALIALRLAMIEQCNPAPAGFDPGMFD